MESNGLRGIRVRGGWQILQVRWKRNEMNGGRREMVLVNVVINKTMPWRNCIVNTSLNAQKRKRDLSPIQSLRICDVAGTYFIPFVQRVNQGCNKNML